MRTSPARDAGTATGAPLTDLHGLPRTPPPDIGAYEFGYLFCDDFESGDTSAWSQTAPAPPFLNLR